jgi:hypothetical protein
LEHSGNPTPSSSKIPSPNVPPEPPHFSPSAEDGDVASLSKEEDVVVTIAPSEHDHYPYPDPEKSIGAFLLSS